MTLEFIDNYLNQKIKNNEKHIVFTFFELRVKENLSEEEVLNFIYLVSQKLVNLGYVIYKTKEKYYYNGQVKEVKENELLIAIKDDNE